VLPGLAGGVEVVGDMVGVAEADRCEGFIVPIAVPSEVFDRVLVAGDRLGVVAELVVCVAEVVPGGGLTDAVAEVLLQIEGSLAGDERLVGIPELDLTPADRVEGSPLTGAVADLAVQVEGLLGMV
jgi:hypothetical protein